MGGGVSMVGLFGGGEMDGVERVDLRRELLKGVD